MSVTIRSVLERTEHPNQRFYSPDLETLVKGSQTISLPSANHTIDTPLQWQPVAFGQSGWDYNHNVAHFLTLEFDATEGHENNRYTCTRDQLENVTTFLAGLPYVDVTRSTSGKGYHARIQAEQHPCHSRQEYLALRRRMVTYLDGLGEVSISDKLDPQGRGILWLWRAAQ